MLFRGGQREGLHDRVVVAEQGGQFRSERDPGRAGQSRKIDDQIRRLLVGESQGVAEHQPALRVRVADFHRQSLAGREHVPRPVCIAADGVLHHGHQHPQPCAYAGAHQHVREAKGHGRAAHVFFHERHAGAGLDVETAAVEAHALAHQGQARKIFAAARAPAQLDQPGRFTAGPAHGMDGREIRREKILSHPFAVAGLVALGEAAGGGLIQSRAIRSASAARATKAASAFAGASRPAASLFDGR